MKNAVIKSFIFATILLGLQATHAQEKKGLPLPLFGLGPAVGWETGDLGNADISGPAIQLRTLSIVSTFPVIGVGYDINFSRLNATESGVEVAGDRIKHGPLVATMIPLHIFGVTSVPKGFGPPIYAGLVLNDRIDFTNSTGSLTGSGWKAGMQVPFLAKTVLQFEYSETTYDENAATGFFGAGDQKAKTWSFQLQFPMPLIHR